MEATSCWAFAGKSLGQEEELRDFAIRELEIDHYDIWKDLLRNPEYAKLGEVIDEVEAPDYGFELEEE